MPTYRDHAVVLRKLDYGEADRIYTLLTAHHGKVGAIAKGVRRTSSKLAPALELYARVDVLLGRGRNLDVIAQAQRLEGTRLPADPDRTAHAALVAELADRVTEDRHPADGVFELTAAALEELAVEADPARASLYFLSCALELYGYSPELTVCTSCGRALSPEPLVFSAAAGGFLCGRCAPVDAPQVSVAAVKVLRLMAARDLQMYRRLKLTPEVLREVADVLETQLEHHLDRRLRSLEYLRKIR